jgi:hypothetical protein
LEVLVQNEDSEIFLFSAGGTELASLDRWVPERIDPDPEDYAVISGKPAVLYWPPRWPTSSQMAYLPCVDGRLRAVWYKDGELHIEVKGAEMPMAGRCAHFWDPMGPNGPYIIVGGQRGSEDTLYIVDPMAEPELSIVDHLGAIDGVGVENPVAIEGFGEDEILVVARDRLWRIGLDPSTGTFDPDWTPAAGLRSQTIPGVLWEEPVGEVLFEDVQTELGGVAIHREDGAVDWLATSTPDGRIWILDSQLHWTRFSNSVDPYSGSDETEWYANVSLGLRPAVARKWDLSGPTNRLWVYDGFNWYHRVSNQNRTRVLSLDIETGEIDEFVQDGPLHAVYRNMAFDPTGQLYYFQEAGDLWRDSNVTYLYTMHIHANTPVQSGDVDPRAGFVFELTGDGVGGIASGRRMGGFEVPVDPIHWSDPQTGSPWPWEGANRYSGQVTATYPLPGRWTGNSVKVADLTVGGQTSRHVIVGTFGGFVYALEIDSHQDPHALSRYTNDLGWGVVGLDVGDIDGDQENEIVAGTWLDTGSLADYMAGLEDRNRGQLLILDEPLLPGGAMAVTPIDPAPFKFAAGVLGVVLDDINGDGKNEIWCGDGLGYLYVFARDDGGVWRLIFRTRGLGPYPGYYNKIFPGEVDPRSETSVTTHLAVVTPGTIYRFEVRPEQVPWSNN